jgi:hypothetical protein
MRSSESLCIPLRSGSERGNAHLPKDVLTGGFEGRSLFAENVQQQYVSMADDDGTCEEAELAGPVPHVYSIDVQVRILD